MNATRNSATNADPQGGERQERTRATDPGAGINSLKYADILRRIAEIEALKKANIVRTEAQTLNTKAQYQVSMIQWFVQRRYEHVLMAARFYNQIWKDGDATLRIDKNSDVSKLFSESVGVSPTVASLDSLSNEAIREVDKYVEAFDLMLSRDELHSASQRLMEAYALGEYLAPVATLPLGEKTPRARIRPRSPRTLRHPPGPRLHQDQGTRRPPQDQRQGFPLLQSRQRHRRLHARLGPRHRGSQGPSARQGQRQGRRENQGRHRDLADQSQAHRVPQPRQPAPAASSPSATTSTACSAKATSARSPAASTKSPPPSKAMPPARTPSNKS